ncbi:cytochrome c [Pendulispora brunnea]|uniref:Cytochrome c n=1 Tax=Pendulispora brunnea TaxID=2905690 RepID=A0ABZ2JZC9_9BACT
MRHSINILAVFFLAACSGDDDGGVTTLTLMPVTWNPSSIETGQVQAVAEYDTTVAVFGAAGVTTFVSGSVVGTDPTVTAWRSAGVIPSASGLGTWIVGVDGQGRLQRVLGHDGVENVSDRFGLASDKVAGLAGSQRATGFLLEQGLATSDGTTVKHYTAPALRAVASAAGRVAIAADDGVRIVTPGQEAAQETVALPDAAFVAYDAAGTLFSATHHGVYRLDGGDMRSVYDAGARTIRGLASSGANVWFAVDGDLALVKDGHVAISSGLGLAGDGHDVQLAGSPSGDVWVVAGGQLLRYAAGAGGTDDEAAWTANVQPVYATVCSHCHSAPGTGKDASNVDLSTYALWSARRAAVYQRVVAQAGTPAAMPPSGSGFSLTDAQRAAIEAWSKP